MYMQTMHIPLCTLTTLLVLLDGTSNALDEREAMDMTFRQRSRSDWEKVWHQESHSRCRDKLVRHLFWACDKDIYRLERRSGHMLDGIEDHHAIKKQTLTLPWLDRETATQMLRTNRGGRRRSVSGSGSITSECCTRNGCTWEEYAEYCPANNRIV